MNQYGEAFAKLDPKTIRRPRSLVGGQDRLHPRRLAHFARHHGEQPASARRRRETQRPRHGGVQPAAVDALRHGGDARRNRVREGRAALRLSRAPAAARQHENGPAQNHRAGHDRKRLLQAHPRSRQGRHHLARGQAHRTRVGGACRRARPRPIPQRAFHLRADATNTP